LNRIILATRKSPLALAQAELAASRLRAHFPGVECALLKVVTTGDRKVAWSLEKQGGKGLFTAELEQAILRGEADVAVHSSKDLPNELANGLVIAGYLPREDPRDVLVVRAGVTAPGTIATGSPRRRLQISLKFPGAVFTEIRGNVDTRLKKIVAGAADATVLAASPRGRGWSFIRWNSVRWCRRWGRAPLRCNAARRTPRILRRRSIRPRDAC
jgi:hydroxymethylbilane synthase